MNRSLMVGIEHIISPQSAPWCAWVLLGLLLLAIVSELMQPGVITNAATSLIVRSERTYKEAPNNFMGQLFVSLFRVGVWGMGVYLVLGPNHPFLFSTYAAICGCIMGGILFKWLCTFFLDVIYMFSRRFPSAQEHLYNIFTLSAVALYPLLLILIVIDNPLISAWVVGLILIIFLLAWIYRSARLFIISPSAIIYFILYISTLEIIPIVLVYYLSAKIINI